MNVPLTAASSFPPQVRATGLIARLFRDTAHLEPLLSSGALLQTLARVLREDGKKSLDLAINVVAAFFSVSNFTQLHPLISQHQVGLLCIELIELEIKRTELRCGGG